jgi:hypothetical protein
MLTDELAVRQGDPGMAKQVHTGVICTGPRRAGSPRIVTASALDVSEE